MISKKSAIAIILCAVVGQSMAMKRPADGDISEVPTKMARTEMSVEEPEPSLNELLEQEDLDMLLARLTNDTDADVNEKDEHGFPLVWNVLNSGLEREQQDELFNILVKKGADVNAQAPESNCTILHCAVSEGDVRRVKQIVMAGGNGNIEDYAGLIPFDYLASMTRKGVNRLDIAKSLADVTDLNRVTSKGNTLLHAPGIDEPVAKFLVLRGVSVDATNNAGETAYQYLERKHGRVAGMQPIESIKNIEIARKDIIMPVLVPAMKPSRQEDNFPTMPHCLTKSVFNRELSGKQMSGRTLASKYDAIMPR